MNSDQAPQSTPELSIVVPAFNEEAGIRAFLEQLTGVLRDCSSAYEILLIDDGSRDATWEQLRSAQAQLPNLHGVRFTRNFGKEAAILAGLRQARGSAVIVMDADGQHPPSLLPQMLALWRNGQAQIVAAQKIDRNADGLLARLNAYCFNGLMRMLTGLDLSGASDFRLLDRRVVDALLAFPEKVRFFRGMTVWTGFITKQIGFEVAPRIAGNSQWSTSQLTRLAITAITSFSAKPLGMIFRLGLLGLLMAFLLFLQALYSWLSGIAVSGWTSLTVIVLLFGSATLLSLGVLGAYLAQIFDEIKRRPEFLIQESLGQWVDERAEK
jgi:glycosyltransferase involved in cell wall biosynthesis